MEKWKSAIGTGTETETETETKTGIESGIGISQWVFLRASTPLEVAASLLQRPL